MTQTTREIFEKYQVRKTKKQKSAFIEYVKRLSDEWGYSCKIEKGSFGARNIVIGDVSNAKVVYTAHYDTCPKMPVPNFITPKCITLYILYQILLTLLIFAVGIALAAFFAIIMIPLELDDNTITWIIRISLLAVLSLLYIGPANKHTANDNTSGTTLLIDIMHNLPEDARKDVAFVFFDLEEMGLFGSQSFAKAHKAEMKNRLLINFDCVSDGENILLVLRKGAIPYQNAIKAAFVQRYGFKVEIVSKGAIYPSDQINFRCGVGVCALRSTERGLLYVNRIHTKRDTIYQEKNIDFLKNSAIELAQILKNDLQ